MKKIFGFFVVAIIIFLAGCSNVTEKPTENPTTVTPPTSVTAAPTEPTVAPTTTEETVYYTVKYCDEDGNSIKEEKVEKGKSPSYAYDKKDTKEWDYSFDGWSLTLGGEVVTNLPVVTADITYYATISKVKNQYSITFESNGGSSVVSIKLDYGTEVNAPTKPTKDGFSFVSWCTDKALTTAITWPYVIEDNITLYASWNEKVDISQYLSALLKGYELNPIVLQMALNFLIKRFPPFATTVKKGFFWYYLESSRHYYKVNKESGLPCQSLDLRYFESPSFRVVYYENRISVEYFHLLTDGAGGTEFIKALIMEYYRLLGVKDESIHQFDLNETPKSSEFESGFDLMEKKENPPSFIDKPALEMSSKLSFTKPCQVIHFKMNLDKLKEVSKSYNATITEYILYLMFLASKASIDDTEGNISIQVPINLRKYYDTLTLGNFSLYCGISLPLNEVDHKDSAIETIKEEMKEKTSKLSMENMGTSTRKFIKSLSYIPLIIKGPITKIVYGYVGDRLYTSTLSNLGKVEMDKVYQDHILSMDFVLGTTVSNRATVSLVTINNILTLSISKNTTDPTFENILYDKLIKDGMELVVEGSAIYGN